MTGLAALAKVVDRDARDVAERWRFGHASFAHARKHRTGSDRREATAFVQVTGLRIIADKRAGGMGATPAAARAGANMGSSSTKRNVTLLLAALESILRDA